VAMAWGPFPAYPVFASSSQAVSLTRCTDSMPHWPQAREAGGVGPVGVEAGDSVDDFLAYQLAVCVVAVAADPGDARGLREVGASGVGDPDGAADGAAVGAVQVRVVGCAALAAGLDGVEAGALEERRVSLDVEEAVSP
jgi:hypothetical protein